jgi:hypothetical protein
MNGEEPISAPLFATNFWKSRGRFADSEKTSGQFAGAKVARREEHFLQGGILCNEG